MCEPSKNLLFAILAIALMAHHPRAQAQTGAPAKPDADSQELSIGEIVPVQASATGSAQTTPSEIRISQIDLHIIPCWKLDWPKCTDTNNPIIRYVFIEGSENVPITVSARPLTSTDGNAHLSASAFTLSKTPVTIDPINGTNIIATFNLKGVPSGSYVGALTVVYNNSRTVVPISLKISSSLEPVLFVLLIGLVVSLGVTAYVVKRRDLDHIKISAFRTEDSINRDKTIHLVFRNRIQSDLDRLHASVKREDLAQAVDILESATKCLEKWRKHNAGWRHNLNNLDSLLQKIGAIKQKNNSLSSLENQLQAIEINAVDLDDPSELAESLAVPTKLFLKADQVVTSINRLAHLVNSLKSELNDAEKSKILSGFDHYKDRFRHLDLDDDQEVEKLNAEINATVDEIRSQADQLLSPDPVVPRKSLGQIVSNVVGEWLERGAAVQVKDALGRLSGNMVSITFSSGLAGIREIDFDRLFTKLRRATFVFVGYVVLMIILAGSGLDQLYLSNPTFGANVWSDYISLFAWGFGAEAARSSVVRLAGSWQLPGLRQPQTGA